MPRVIARYAYVQTSVIVYEGHPTAFREVARRRYVFEAIVKGDMLILRRTVVNEMLRTIYLDGTENYYDFSQTKPWTVSEKTRYVPELAAGRFASFLSRHGLLKPRTPYTYERTMKREMPEFIQSKRDYARLFPEPHSVRELSALDINGASSVLFHRYMP